LPVPDEPSDLERLGEDVLGVLADAGSALTYEDPAKKLQAQRNLELLDDGLAFLEELNRQTALSAPPGSLAAGERSNLGNELLGISDLRRAIKAAREGDDAAAALYSAMAFPGFKLLKPAGELGEELAKRGTGATKAGSGAAARRGTLRSNLEKVHGPLSDGYEAHHLIVVADRRAGGARRILDRFNIDPNSAVNGVALPGRGSGRVAERHITLPSTPTATTTLSKRDWPVLGRGERRPMRLA
jgi:hypothetical protein